MIPSSSRTLKYIFSYELFLVMLACLLVGAALLLRAVGMEALRAMELLPVRVFFIAIAVNRAGGLVLDLLYNRGRLLLSAGIIVVLAGMCVNATMWYRGTAGLGAGEQMKGFEQVSRGIFAGELTGSDMIVNSISGDVLFNAEESEVEILVEGGRRAVLRPGASKWLSRLDRVKVESVEAAPLFQVRTRQGSNILSSFVKLDLHPIGTRDYFMVTPLPHRFYLSLTGSGDKPLRLVITRGRLIIFEDAIDLKETVSVDDISVSIPSLTGWASITVERYPGLAAMLAGTVMVVAGIGFILWRRYG